MTELHNSNTPLAIYLDLSKAFDTIDHQILLQKLSYYGIKDTALSWFESYLTDRQQYVQLGEHESEVKYLSTGVPQFKVPFWGRSFLSSI